MKNYGNLLKAFDIFPSISLGFFAFLLWLIHHGSIGSVNKQNTKNKAYFNVILKINLDILIDLSKKYEYKMNDIDNKEVVEKNILKSKCFCGIGLNSICFLQIELIFSSKQQQSQKWMFHFI